MTRACSEIKSTAILIVRRRIVSPTAIGRREPVLAKSHDGSSANIGTYHLRNLADHLGEKPQKQIRGSGPQSIVDMRGAQSRPPGPRSGREGEEGLAHLVSIGGRSSLGSDTTQGVHVSTVHGWRQRMKETKGRDNIIGRLDRRILRKANS